MTGSKRITDAAIEALTTGIFAKSEPLVIEAYSEIDHEPLTFVSADTLADYIKFQLSKPRGLAYFFVVYPNMKGCPVKKRIELNPQAFPNKGLRYTWEGWGLISVQLYGDESWIQSGITANSEKRANAWSVTYPEWYGPDTWDWKAVASHVLRLQRILKPFL